MTPELFALPSEPRGVAILACWLDAQAAKPVPTAFEPALCPRCQTELEVRWGRHSETWRVSHHMASRCELRGYLFADPDREKALAAFMEEAN